MSRAEELLNVVSEEVPVHTHPVPDTDTYFIIDPITRKIENTNRKKTVVMQYDHNSERFTFELPRYIDGHDMLECTSVTVNVDNIEVVEVDDVEPRINSDAPDLTDLQRHPNDPEKAIVSWLVSRNSTQLSGILSFHIEFKCVDSSGNVVYEWSTDNFDEIEVRARKKNGEAAVMPYTDVLEQWRTSIFGAGDSVMANITAEGNAQVAAVKMESATQQEAVELKGAQTLDSIPEDYTETNNMADEAVRSKAAAIICEAVGESVIITDSSDDHIRGLKIFGKSKQSTTTGKNLLKNTASKKTAYGVTYTSNADGSVTITGTSTASSTYEVDFQTPIDYQQESLTLSLVGAVDGVTIRLGYFKADGSITDTLIVVGKTEKEFTYPEEATHTRAYIHIDTDKTYNCTVYPMVRRSIVTDDSYEPYTGGKPAPNPEYPQEIVSVESPTVNICSKNLLDITKAELIVVGASGSKRYGIIFDKLGTYTFSCKTDEGIAVKVVTDGKYGDYTTLIGDVSHTFTLTESQYLIIYQGSEGKMFNAGLEDAQIEQGDIATDYEPYKGHDLIIPSTIPGLPVNSGGNYTDSDGQQWICDEVDLERGVYRQRLCRMVFDGSEDWAVGSNCEVGLAFPYPRSNPVCRCSTHYTYGVKDGGFWFGGAINIRDNTNAVSRDSWLTWLADQYTAGIPVTLVYSIATPIETPLTAEEITAFKTLRTNYPNTTILNDAGAWMSVKYNADTKTYVENPKVLRLVDSSTGVVYELVIVDGQITVNPV